MQNREVLVAIAHPPETQVVNRNIQVASDTIKASLHTSQKPQEQLSCGLPKPHLLTEEEAQALSPLFLLGHRLLLNHQSPFQSKLCLKKAHWESCPRGNPPITKA